MVWKVRETKEFQCARHSQRRTLTTSPLNSSESWFAYWIPFWWSCSWLHTRLKISTSITTKNITAQGSKKEVQEKILTLCILTCGFHELFFYFALLFCKQIVWAYLVYTKCIMLLVVLRNLAYFGASLVNWLYREFLCFNKNHLSIYITDFDKEIFACRLIWQTRYDNLLSCLNNSQCLNAVQVISNIHKYLTKSESILW